jgi:hypothetical protein
MLTGNSEDSTDEIDFIGILIVNHVKFHRARPSRMHSFKRFPLGVPATRRATIWCRPDLELV